MDSQQIEVLIKKYEGIPYRHAGKDLTGLDCLGLAHFFYKDCGIEIPQDDGAECSENWFKIDPERYLRGLLALGQEAPIDNLLPLDFVYFRMRRHISHGGVMIDSQNFLHVLQKTIVHVSPLDPSWRKHLVGARRLI